MGLKWGDMYKCSNAMGFTISENVRNHPVSSTPAVLVPPASYDIRLEDLFEEDEFFYEEVNGMVFDQARCNHPIYTTPSRQTGSCVPFKLAAIDEDGDGEIHFPSYDGIQCSYKAESVGPSAETTCTPVSNQPGSLGPNERPMDNSAIQLQPSRQVDYLSHEWSEEDVWTSWKHIVSKRGPYNDSARLENASWRSWAKKKSDLRTVPPEIVKWMKDHDLTWLYCPLTPSHPCTSEQFFIIAIINAGSCYGNKERKFTNIFLIRVSSAHWFEFEHQHAQFEILSGLEVETPERWKRVRFHELVEQCIALANAEDEDEEHEHEYHHYCSDSDDDVEVIVTRRKAIAKKKQQSTSKWLPPTSTKTTKRPAMNISKTTIKKLPHAPLKAAQDLEKEDVHEHAMIEESRYSSRSSSPSPSSSPEYYTTSDHVILLDLESDAADDMDWQWRPPAWLQDRKDRVSHSKIQRPWEDQATAEATQPCRRQLTDRRDAKSEQDLPHGHSPTLPTPTYSSFLDLLPCRSHLTAFSLNTDSPQTQTQRQRQGRPWDEYPNFGGAVELAMDMDMEMDEAVAWSQVY